MMSMVMWIFWLAVLGGAVFVGYVLGRRQLPPAGRGSESQRLVEQQMERIELLESELDRLREQADFTERLLEERNRGSSDDA